MTTTPYDARRSMRIREASEKAYHLAHIIKDYPNHRKDGDEFGASQLNRIEKILNDTTEIVAAMVVAERKQTREAYPGEFPEPAAVDFRRYATTATEVIADRRPEMIDFKVGSDPAEIPAPGPETVVRIVEPTIPVSLYERLRKRGPQGDCD